MTQGFLGFLLPLGAGCGCCYGAGNGAVAGPGLKYVLLCLQIMMKIKILNSLKTKVP